MLELLRSQWWVLVLRGVLSILFGVVAIVQPMVAGLAMALVFGVFALLDGVMSVWTAVTGRSKHRWLLGLLGLISLVAAYVAFREPITALIAFVIVIGAWAIVRGVFEIAAGIALRKEIDHEWLLIVAGLLSIIFGLLLLATPIRGMLAVIWIIGFYAFLWGGLLIALGLRLKKLPA